MRMERARLADGPGPNRLLMARTASMFLGDRWEHVYRADDAAIRVHTTAPLTETQSFIEISASAAWIF
jgi:iron(III) transport system ATP-binding protein